MVMSYHYAINHLCDWFFQENIFFNQMLFKKFRSDFNNYFAITYLILLIFRSANHYHGMKSRMEVIITYLSRPSGQKFR